MIDFANKGHTGEFFIRDEREFYMNFAYQKKKGGINIQLNEIIKLWIIEETL